MDEKSWKGSGPQAQRVLSLYDLLLTELGDTLTPEQAAVFGFTRHELRAGRPMPADQVIWSMRILSELAAASDRPDLVRKVQGFLRDNVTVSRYAGPPLTRAQLSELQALYKLATTELRGLPRIFANIRHRLRRGARVPDDMLVDGLRFLGERAADQRRSDLVVRLLSAYLDLLPDEWVVWFNLGNHLAHLSDRQAAIAAYDEALRGNPAHAWGWFNRGRLHSDLGHHDQAMSDWIQAARHDCDLEGFPYTVARRIIPWHGFVAMARIVADPTLPQTQRRNLAMALRRALNDACDFDGWYMAAPLGLSREEERPFVTLMLHAELADIRRESPVEPFVFFTRTATGYDVRTVDKTELRESLWYLPPGEPPGPPDRVHHLVRLDELLRSGAAADALEATWGVHYATGAIALSCLMDGAVDWPTPVKRLAVPGQPGEISGFHLDERQRTAVVRWISENTGADVTDHALAHFRAASDTLKALSLAATAPDTEAVVDAEDMTRFVNAYVADPKGLSDQDPITFRPGSVLRAESLWWYVEPVYREWVLAASYGERPAARLTALCHARQFNALAATELWSEVPPETWRACRERILTAYDPDVTLADVQAAIGSQTMLLDYYTYEIFGETVSQLAVTASAATVTTRDVDVIGGELRAMIVAGRPAALPATGFPPLAERPLALPATLPRTLLLVPYGYLREIPLHALPTVQAAIDRGDVDRVVYLPTVSAVCRQPGPAPQTQRALFVGYDADGDIGLEYDLACLRGYVDDVTVLTGEAATLTAVTEQMPLHDIVHFACHGNLDTRLAAGYLTLAGGRLYPWHVLSQPVPHTIIMNACLGINVQRIEVTSDGAFGLHDAFLLAGAQHVVGGLWEVTEWTSRQFAASLYAYLAAGQDVPASVTRAQRDLRRATPHPLLWAPHACFGEWRT